MNLKKISFRNLGPYGNKLQTIELSKDGGLWLVVGRNGSGKCHSRDTKLYINIDNKETADLFLKFLEKKHQ